MNSATGFRAMKTFSFVIDAMAEEARVFVFVFTYRLVKLSIRVGYIHPCLLGKVINLQENVFNLTTGGEQPRVPMGLGHSWDGHERCSLQ